MSTFTMYLTDVFKTRIGKLRHSVLGSGETRPVAAAAPTKKTLTEFAAITVVTISSFLLFACCLSVCLSLSLPPPNVAYLFRITFATNFKT